MADQGNNKKGRSISQSRNQSVAPQPKHGKSSGMQDAKVLQPGKPNEYDGSPNIVVFSFPIPVEPGSDMKMQVYEQDKLGRKELIDDNALVKGLQSVQEFLNPCPDVKKVIFDFYFLRQVYSKAAREDILNIIKQLLIPLLPKYSIGCTVDLKEGSPKAEVCVARGTIMGMIFALAPEMGFDILVRLDSTNDWKQGRDFQFMSIVKDTVA